MPTTPSMLHPWFRKLDEHRDHFTDAGLNGLLDHHGVTNRLGEKLARGEVKPELIEALLAGCVTVTPLPEIKKIRVPADDPSGGWPRFWQTILGREVAVPMGPTLSPKTITAAREFGFMAIPLPVIAETDYPSDFVKPDWGRHLTASEIKRRKLPGRMVLVETIAKPHWDDPRGYGGGNDPLARALGLQSRFKVSWDELHQTHLPAAAKLLGLSRRAVRCPSAEEWNLVGNLFLWLNNWTGTSLPDLGSTRSWEWCENAYGSSGRLVAGNADDGGLANVDAILPGNPFGNLGFRVLAVLTA